MVPRISRHATQWPYHSPLIYLKYVSNERRTSFLFNRKGIDTFVDQKLLSLFRVTIGDLMKCAVLGQKVPIGRNNLAVET